MAETKVEIDFLTNKNNYYLSDNSKVQYQNCSKINPKDLALYRIDEISFEDKAPRKEALENVLSAMKIEGIYFIYLILGDDMGVHFYYGAAKDYSKEMDMDLSVYDIGKYILESSIKGNFRGSKTEEVKPEQKKEIMNLIANMQYYSMLEGVPGYTKEDEKFQGVDRLVDVMLGDTFGFMILASAVNYDEIKEIESNLYEVYKRIVPFSKKSLQDGTSKNESYSRSETKGTSTNLGKSTSESEQKSECVTDGTNRSNSTGTSKSTTKGTSSTEGGSYSSNGTSNSAQEGKTTGESNGTSHSIGKTTGESKTSGVTTSEGTSESVSEQKGNGSGFSRSTTIEYIDKKAQDWIKYLDEVIIPRLDYGTGKGIFITTSFLFSDNKASLKKLENTAISLYSGEKGNKIPLKAVPLANKTGNKRLAMLKNFQLPTGSFGKDMTESEPISRSALSQFVEADRSFYLGNWITTNELAMIAGLPQKDVVGLGLREEVEFGLNFEHEIAKEDQIALGKLVQSGNVIEKIDVFLDKKNMDKHIFITGVTGSGKTTTCHKILIDSDLPFLVIEPAKTEYRILADRYQDLIVFTLGKDTVAPFRLNPFEFFRHESITSRVDMIRASIEASFEMEAAIPQLIETAIYECYKDYGWNIASNKNLIFGESAFDDGVYAFPTLADLIHKVDAVVVKQGFDERLKNDYIGSIKARLQGLLMGSKGLMLNTRRSIDFEDLLKKRVVLEFEEIRSATEKSLVMGFVLTNLIEAIKARFLKYGAYHHITLVEEAHRLLSKFSSGDSPNKKHGVETFTDMLAEIRKYGESLIIVDQIPNKLTPEVLKNTNTKIVHKLFAEDDKDAIGNTIVLDQDQKNFLSNLETGRAIVFTQGFHKAVQVQIHEVTDTTSEIQISEERLRNMVFSYYAQQYKRGVLLGTQFFEQVPETKEIERLIELSLDEELGEIIQDFCKKCECNKNHAEKLAEYLKYNKAEFLGKYITMLHYLGKKKIIDQKKLYERERQETIIEWIEKYSKQLIKVQDIRGFKDRIL